MASAEKLTQQAFELARQGKLKKALQLFEKAFDKNPNLIDALFGQGAVHYRAGNHEEARKIFSRVLDMRPTHDRALKYLNKCDDIIEKSNPQEFAPSPYESTPTTETTEEPSYGAQSWESSPTSYGDESETVPGSVPTDEFERRFTGQTETTEPEGEPTSSWDMDSSSSSAKSGPPKEEPKKKSTKVLKIVAINLMLLILALGVIFAIHFFLSNSDFFSSKPTQTQTTTTTGTDGERSGAEGTDDSWLADDDIESTTLEPLYDNTYSEPSHGASMFGTALILIGSLLTFATWVIFVYAAFSESFGKGVLCFCCTLYLYVFVLLEYKSESKWLFVGLHVIGWAIRFIGEIVAG